MRRTISEENHRTTSNAFLIIELRIDRVILWHYAVNSRKGSPFPAKESGVLKLTGIMHNRESEQPPVGNKLCDKYDYYIILLPFEWLYPLDLIPTRFSSLPAGKLRRRGNTILHQSSPWMEIEENRFYFVCFYLYLRTIGSLSLRVSLSCIPCLRWCRLHCSPEARNDNKPSCIGRIGRGYVLRESSSKICIVKSFT